MYICLSLLYHQIQIIPSANAAGSNAAGSNAAGSNAAGSNAAGPNAAGSNAAGLMLPELRDGYNDFAAKPF